MKTRVFLLVFVMVMVTVTVVPTVWGQCCCGQSGFCMRGQHKLIGQQAPAFTLKDVNGEDISLEKYKGNTVILVFFTTWSDKAIETLSKLEEISKNSTDKGLSVIGITPEKDLSVVKTFIEDHHITFPVALDNGDVLKQYYVGCIPDIYCINKKGEVHARFVGKYPESDTMVERTVAVLLDEKEVFSVK